VFLTGEKFYEVMNGLSNDFFDPSLGLVNYRGQTFLKTTATAFVRDGTEFTVYLPSENKFIRRPALSGDSEFFEHKFSAEGIWQEFYCSTEKLFGYEETVSRSVTLAGEKLITRRNGDVFVKRQDGFAPFYASETSAQPEFIRVDLEVPDTHGHHIATLFFEPKSTGGAREWLGHFRAAQTAVQKIAQEASPFIRNYNTVFYNGEGDLAECVKALRQVTEDINAVYESDLESSNSGKLWVPTMENVSSSLLNQLHFEFENFGERFKKGSAEVQNKIRSVYGPFCQLNDCIHATEGALSNRDRTMEEAWWALHCAFMPDFYKKLPDELYPEFTLDWKFGTLYMGYHTLGKDILAAFWNDDLDLFHRDEIRPQRISSSEFFIFLGPGTEGQMEALERWWREKNIDQFGYRFGDPRNSIGYIPVASLVRDGLSDLDVKTALKGCRKILAASLAKV
jgi:hypothetical protein